MIGIYALTSNGSGKAYIGSSTNLRQRKYYHFYCLERNKHKNKHLQNVFNKHKDVVFSIIERCEKSDLLAKEQYWIDQFIFDDLLNNRPTAGMVLHSEETKCLLSDIQSNRDWKTGGHNKGVPHSDDTKRKIAKSVSKARRKIPDVLVSEIKRLRVNGFTYPAITGMTGVSVAQVHRLCNGMRNGRQTMRSWEKSRGLTK